MATSHQPLDAMTGSPEQAGNSSSGGASRHEDEETGGDDSQDSLEYGEDNVECNLGTSTETDTDPEDLKKVGMSKAGIFSQRERKAYIGFCAQYFAVGIIYGGIPATVYGVFLGYLNVPSYVYATVSVISTIPWSFKFFFGLINDTLPIRGQKRKPYMCMGWAFCACVLVCLSFMELPPPYWCIDESTGKYIKKVTLPDGHFHAAEPCHPESAEEGGKYTIMLMLAALGYVIADVAADGLLTEYAKAEPIEKRGSTQTTAYLVRTVGSACSTLFVGVCMNSKRYNGSFDWGLSFEQVIMCFAVPAALMVPISALLVHEPRSEEQQTCGQYFAMCWELLKSKAFFFAILYMFVSPVISGISTTAGAQVKMNWAGVQNLQNQMFSLVGSLLFIVGLYLVKRRFLNTNWRVMLLLTSVFLTVVDSFFTTLTIFDVVRNQYFYLGETVLVEIPTAANFVISTFIVVEMADDGNEGLVYGLMTTAGNLGYPFARAIGNQVYGLFQPSLSSADNYIEDKPAFRLTVFWSFMLSYGFGFLSLAMLLFLPQQKEEAQRRKRTWPRRPIYGYITLTMLSVALCYSMIVNFMEMSPETMCLKFAGGDGCDKAAPVAHASPLGNSTR